ncbi:COG4223 family protein [Roseovarius sp.]|uniref:COG4223 family protein n=1 Tax=Roseovarius sp. TaxID=1486281 RepID=UPI00351662D7
MSSDKKNSKRDEDTAAKAASKPEAKPEAKTGAKTGATAKSDAKPAAAKPEAAKPEAAKPEAAAKAATSAKADAPAKPDTAAKPATGKPDPVKSEPVKSDTAKPADKATDKAADKPADSAKNAPSQNSRNTDELPTSKSAATPPPTPTPPASETVGGAGFGALFFGGVTAALVGALAAYLLLPQLGLLPQGDDEALTRLETRLAEQDKEISALSQQLADMASAQPETVSPDQIADIEAQLSALGDRLAAAETLAQRAAPAGEAVSSDELQKLREEMDRLLAEAAQKDDQARTAARDTLRRAALTRVRTALDNGSTFAEALDDLGNTGQEIPSDLQAIANGGAPTLAALQTSFPDAARRALEAARRADPDAHAGSGVLGFLNSQLGVRSLEPREGTDPDAILSRAEAALRDGQLAATLEELATLPDPAQAEIAGWVEQAQTRLTATQAADTLGAQLN